jgi:hypothetical protein
VRPEGWGTLIKSIHLIGSRTSYLPACSIMTQQLCSSVLHDKECIAKIHRQINVERIIDGKISKVFLAFYENQAVAGLSSASSLHNLDA